MRDGGCYPGFSLAPAVALGSCCVPSFHHKLSPLCAVSVGWRQDEASHASRQHLWWALLQPSSPWGMRESQHPAFAMKMGHVNGSGQRIMSRGDMPFLA